MYMHQEQIWFWSKGLICFEDIWTIIEWGPGWWPRGTCRREESIHVHPDTVYALRIYISSIVVVMSTPPRGHILTLCPGIIGIWQHLVSFSPRWFPLKLIFFLLNNVNSKSFCFNILLISSSIHPYQFIHLKDNGPNLRWYYASIRLKLYRKKINTNSI